MSTIVDPAKRKLLSWPGSTELRSGAGEEPGIRVDSTRDNVALDDLKETDIHITRIRYNVHAVDVDEYRGVNWLPFVKDTRTRVNGIPDTQQWIHLSLPCMNWTLMKALAQEYNLHPLVVEKLVECMSSWPKRFQSYGSQFYFAIPLRAFERRNLRLQSFAEPEAGKPRLYDDYSKWQQSVLVDNIQYIVGVVTSDGTLLTVVQETKFQELHFKRILTRLQVADSILRRSGVDALIVAFADLGAYYVCNALNIYGELALWECPVHFLKPEATAAWAEVICYMARLRVQYQTIVNICNAIRDSDKETHAAETARAALMAPGWNAGPHANSSLFSDTTKAYSYHVLDNLTWAEDILNGLETALNTKYKLALAWVERPPKPDAQESSNGPVASTSTSGVGHSNPNAADKTPRDTKDKGKEKEKEAAAEASANDNASEHQPPPSYREANDAIADRVTSLTNSFRRLMR